MPGRGPASISRMRPWAVRWSASAVSSAASRPSRIISYTVKMTRQCGACALISREAASAASNFERTRTRLLIFSLKILSLGMPWLLSASSWESSSCPRVEQRAYPMRMSALGSAGSIGTRGGVPGLHEARPAVRRGRHPQCLLQAGHPGEAAGVVGGGDRAAARAAGRAGLRAALRTGVLFDVVGVRPIGRGELLIGLGEHRYSGWR